MMWHGPIVLLLDIVMSTMLMTCITVSNPAVVKHPLSKTYILEASLAARPITNGRAVWLWFAPPFFDENYINYRKPKRLDGKDEKYLHNLGIECIPHR